MNAEDIARKAAGDLAVQFGPELLTNTEAAIRGKLPPVLRSRDVATTVEVAAIAHLVVATAHFLVTLAPQLSVKMSVKWKGNERAEVRRTIKSGVKNRPPLKSTTADRAIDAVMNSFVESNKPPDQTE
jgi:hypothetical protein